MRANNTHNNRSHSGPGRSLNSIRSIIKGAASRSQKKKKKKRAEASANTKTTTGRDKKGEKKKMASRYTLYTVHRENMAFL
jgi:hypothetical protein